MVGLVLVIEDEVDLATTLEYNLTAEGFQVRLAHSGRQGLASATADPLPDVIVLDLMLPDLSGTEICRRLREQERTRDIPVIMCTAKGEEIDRVVGFEVGADDYVVKPFSTKELVSRVRAVMRRQALEQGRGTTLLRIGRLALDPARHRVEVDGKPVHLTPTEFRLFSLLGSRPGEVYSRAEIMRHVWETDYVADPRTVDVHVRNIRRKIERDPGNPEHLVSVRGFGYQLLPGREG
jgi:DNA-binding response OmpR family regulator